MRVKVKKLKSEAVIPTYAKSGDAALDLTALTREFDSTDLVTYGTGLAFEIPEGYVGLVYPRSSIANKDMILSNCVGVIDSGYRGEVMFKFHYASNNIYKVGDRIGQIMIVPYPKIELVESNELSDTERNNGGYGSSGI